MARSKEKPPSSQLIQTDPSRTFNIIVSIISTIVMASGFIYYAYVFLPNLLDQTDDAKSKRLVTALETRKTDEEKRKTDRQAALLSKDADNLVFNGAVANMKTNYGELVIDLKYNAAPKTVESFVRLASRNYFNRLDFHRYVKGENFTVIQGGDPSGNGTGGASAFGTPLQDEMWKVDPILATDKSAKITNDPVLNDPSLYADLNKETGTITYRKGLIIMAKSGAPNSAGSQFFITLADTVLPATYTTFGVIRPENFETLDKINKEVGVIVKNPGTQGYQSTTQDGQPDKELYIETVTTK